MPDDENKPENPPEEAAHAPGDAPEHTAKAEADADAAADDAPATEEDRFRPGAIAARIDSLGEESEADRIAREEEKKLLERKKGKIDFKNQFILLDMLKLFLRSPGEVYSKEALVKAVWKQDYDPSVHDNKIYVTIKRLRQLIEPDFDKPKYI